VTKTLGLAETKLHADYQRDNLSSLLTGSCCAFPDQPNIFIFIYHW